VPALALALLVAVSAAPPVATLAPRAYRALPLGSVKPKGWLRMQLETQARGLTGHLDEFWPDLGPDSGWLGGTGESWERGPYFADGLVPLAYLLDDPRLVAKARRWVEWTLSHQRADGSIGPEKNRDWWPNMVMLKALTQHQEATGDQRVVPLLEKYFAYRARELSQRPLHQWARYRWAEELLSIEWLHGRNHDPKLLDLARELRKQGFDWRAEFLEFAFTLKTSEKGLGLERGQSEFPDLAMRAHGVNGAMGLKAAAVWGLFSGDPADRHAIYRQVAELDRYHGLPIGMPSGDEHYAGKSPSRGVELCAVVEALFSWEQLLSIVGDPAFGDRIETIAYNALPASFSGDMWAHQYDQQPNQVQVTAEPREWVSNGPESNLFGLEPNFGCCTANMHQGWPKLAASLWMASPNGGLAAVVYAPSEVRTAAAGVPVVVTEETEYPFRGTVRIAVDPKIPVRFSLDLRIPAWAEGARVAVNGVGEPAKTGTFHRLERLWAKGDVVELALPLKVRVSRSFRDSLVVERGPVVFSLKIGEDWRKLRDKAPAADWEVLPRSPWNYGLLVDPRSPETSIQVAEKPLGPSPFTPEGAPVELRAKGRRLPGWGIVKGSADDPPGSPVESAEPDETITLIPYGSAKLRLTTFPEVRFAR
jgi:hypothetical protein